MGDRSFSLVHMSFMCAELNGVTLHLHGPHPDTMWSSSLGWVPLQSCRRPSRRICTKLHDFDRFEEVPQIEAEVQDIISSRFVDKWEEAACSPLVFYVSFVTVSVQHNDFISRVRSKNVELDVRMNPTLSRTSMNVLCCTTSSPRFGDTPQSNHGGAICSTTLLRCDAYH